MKTCLLYLLQLITIFSVGQTVSVLGPATALSGESKNYTVEFRNEYNQIISPPQGTHIWTAHTGQVSNTNLSAATVQWTSSGSVEYELETFDNYFYASLYVTVSLPLPPIPNSANYSYTYNCGNTMVTRGTSPPQGATYEWWWQTTTDGTSTMLGKEANLTMNNSSNLYLRARTIAQPYYWSAESQWISGVTVYNSPPAAATQSNPASLIGSGQLTVSVGTVSGTSAYVWYELASGGSPITGQTSASYVVSLTQSQTYYVATRNPGCENSNRLAVSATIYPMPVISATNNGAVAMNSPVTLSVNNFAYDSYQWKDESGSNIPGATSSSYTTTTLGNYKIAVTKGIAPQFVTLNPVPVTLEVTGLDMNYIVDNTVLVSGITTESAIVNLSVTQKSQSIQYFDGLGRPIQAVTTQGSPNKKDIVQPVVYDQFGRETVKYLPYVSTNSNGWYKANALTSQALFYTNTDKVAGDAAPFAVTIFEPSPLNRVLEQGSPGIDWQPDGTDDYTSTDRTIKKAYEFNTNNEVLLWSFTASDATYLFGKVNAGTAASPVYYAANQLYKNKTKDEQHNEVIEYVDKQGRTVLKRVQAVSGSPSSSDVNKDTNYASTYYIYDDFGNLVCVIPPEASNRLPTEYYHAAATDVTKNDFLKRWAFRYAYDSRKRMSIKQVPGAEPVYMVYDNRDRLVLTQDGNQRPNKQWLFTKYDVLNRPVLTGIHTADSTLAQNKMQARVNKYYNELGTNNGAWYESFIGTGAGQVHGYNNKSYPLESASVNYLSATYYDNYDFKTLLSDSSAYSFKTNELSGQKTSYFKRLLGQVTGSKIKVLNGGNATWLNTVSYFDDKYRMIQTVTDNYQAGTDRNTSRYDFVGKVLATITTHTIAPIKWIGLTGSEKAGDRITKTISGNAWSTAGVASSQVLAASTDGWVEFTIKANTTLQAIGYSLSNSDNNWTSIKYAFYLNSNGTFQVRENGSSTNLLTSTPVYSAGDVFRVERITGQIKYYRNGTWLLTRTAVTNALLVDVAFYTSGAEVADFRTSFVPKTQQQVKRSFIYDHAGRLLQTWHRLNTHDSILLVQNEYNELGQLVTKKLHSENGDSFEQHVDQRYNIRGWLERINHADLTPDETNDPRDLFGMDLAYNTSLGLGTTTLQYNGNISAMKWSSNQGLGDTKERGYAFDYDPLNRLLAASHKEKTTTWSASGSFHEDNLSYDLNGNIKSLNRKGKSGSLMDILSYDYGTGSTASNKLLFVTDAGNKNEGFTEVSSGNNDYVYDANGNLVWDRNKGGEESLDNGTFDNGSTNWTLTGLTSRLTFTNGEVQIATGASSATFQQTVVTKSKPYVIVVDVERTAGTLTVSLAGTNSTITTTGTHVFTVTAGTSNTDFRITAGTTFAGKVKSASLKGVTVITYNHLNLPEIVTRAGDKQLRYVYDASGRKLRQELTDAGTLEKGSDYAGEFFYENDTLRFINHEEGRIIPTGNEYQYNLKDHLGNVRLTFTTKQEVESATATMETANASTEQGQFIFYDEAVKINSPLFDHTNAGGSNYSARLNGSANERVGLSKSLSVMPGDTVNIEVYAKYLDTNNGNWTQALTDLMAAIAGGTAPPGTFIDGGSTGSTGGATAPYLSVLNKAGETGTAPKAYLNFITFDRDYNPVIGDFSQTDFKRMTTAAKESGSDVAHEKLSAQIIVKQVGYMYIYLSNDNDTPVDVYFDDFTVEHIKSPVVQQEDYYPFGLTFNSYSRENSVAQDFKYNGKELQDELSLNWLDYGARMYDPAIARWMAIDPLTDLSRRWSPYTYCYNNPLIFVDPDGMFGDYYDQQGKKIGTDGKNDGNKYIVTDKDEAKAIAKTDKAGGTTQVGDVGSERLLPCDDVLTESLDVLSRTEAATTKDPEGGHHGESSIIMKDGSILRGPSGDKAFITSNDEYQANETPAKLPDGASTKDASVMIHSHVTGTKIENGKVYSGDATKPSGQDMLGTMGKYGGMQGTSIIVGPLGQTTASKSADGTVNISKPAVGIAIYNGYTKTPQITLTRKAVERILK